jgi:hypothetical protein
LRTVGAKLFTFQLSSFIDVVARCRRWRRRRPLEAAPLMPMRLC